MISLLDRIKLTTGKADQSELLSVFRQNILSRISLKVVLLRQNVYSCMIMPHHMLLMPLVNFWNKREFVAKR